MTEQQNKPSRVDLYGVLNRARQALDQGDVDGYWRALSPHDPYADLAGRVARNDGPLGRAANERLARKHLENYGEPILEQKVNKIRIEIADADLKARQRSIQDEGDIAIKPDTVAAYHRDVFTANDLPDDTYTLETLGRVLGDDLGGALMGMEERSAEDRGAVSIDGAMEAAGDLIESGLHAVLSDGEPSDGLSRRGQHVIDRRIRERARAAAQAAGDGGDAAPGENGRGADAPEDGASLDGAREMRTGAAAPQHEALPTVADAEGERWRDAWARTLELPMDDPPRAETVLLKEPADWTEGEMRTVLRSDAYWTGEEGERTRRRDAVARWHGLFYGNEPARRDGTGRMIEPAFKIDPPAAAAPPRTREGEPLADALRGTLEAVGREAKKAGPMEAVRRLQAGLNRMTGRAAAQPKPDRRRLRDPYEDEPTPRVERLRVDGDLGPKTAEATRRAVVRFGRKPVEAELRRPAEAQEPDPLFAVKVDERADGRGPVSGGFRA